MKLRLEISPDLAALLQAEIAAGEKATTAMREAGAGIKSVWHGQITGAGLGNPARQLDPARHLAHPNMISIRLRRL